MTELITLYAQRKGTSVVITDKAGKTKGIFPNTGYRPTKATKQITLNCWNWNLKWLNN